MEADKIDSEGNYAVSLFQLIKVQNFVWGVDGGVKVDPLAFFIAAGRVRNFRGGFNPQPPRQIQPWRLTTFRRRRLIDRLAGTHAVV